jgi:hypothetical protein
MEPKKRKKKATKVDSDEELGTDADDSIVSDTSVVSTASTRIAYLANTKRTGTKMRGTPLPVPVTE